MAELRQNPQTKEWVIVASHRQQRPYKPAAVKCPLCPTQKGAETTEIPFPVYEIAVFQNKFPSLVSNPPKPDVESKGLFQVALAQGECEVVVYTPEHEGSMATVGHQKIRNLIEVWADRFEELGARQDVKYVFIFENRGEAVGVTLHHPHGQIYAYPFIPPIPAKEVKQAEEYHRENSRCLYCDILAQEIAEGNRVLYNDGLMTAFVPFAARFPYEVHIFCNNHRKDITELTSKERDSLAEALMRLVRGYDSLLGKTMPYMMVMHQRPTDGEEYGFYHFHIEFLPLNRTADKLKYLAGSESGAGAFVTDMSPEEQANRLKACIRQD
jgi:UDPglucose--hexose-1-phosphate uridylyltransferase